VFATIFIIVLWKQRNTLIKAQEQLRVQKANIEKQQEEISKKSLELAKLNKELYALNQTLENKIIERSNQLNFRNKQIADFTFFNSHKLRAPVASVLGLINVLELSKNGQLDHQILQYLKTSANELDLIIHNLKNILEVEIDDFSDEN
jgi:signal transduction histidine kinase